MSTSSIAGYLSGLDLFKGLDPEYVEFLAENARERNLAENEVLFRYGERAGHFHVVVSGEVVLEVAAIEGPPLELQHVGPGSVLGWSWLIAPFRWNFQARAEAPCELYEFDGETILQRCEKDAAFGYAILKRFSALASERLAFARQRMMDEWRGNTTA